MHRSIKAIRPYVAQLSLRLPTAETKRLRLSDKERSANLVQLNKIVLYRSYERTDTMVAIAQSANDKSGALSSAVTRIADFWGFSNAKLGAVLGLSAATVSRLRAGSTALDPASKSFEAGQFLLRLFRGLDALLGSDDVASKGWLDTHNLDLGARPIERIDTMRGLIEVCDYVDFYRARV